MSLWEKNKSRASYNGEPGKGIYFSYDKCMNDDLKNGLKKFRRWLLRNYAFPVRVKVYFINENSIPALDGEMVYGTFKEPGCPSDCPIIRIAVGDFDEWSNSFGKISPLCGYIKDIVHELTHYYQWIINEDRSSRGMEIQAGIWASRILNEYRDWLLFGVDGD